MTQRLEHGTVTLCEYTMFQTLCHSMKQLHMLPKLECPVGLADIPTCQQPLYYEILLAYHLAHNSHFPILV